MGIFSRRTQTEDFALAPIIVDGQLVTSASIGDRGVMAITAAYRGTNLLADLAAQLPWASIRGGKHSDAATARDPERVDPTPSVLVDPSPFMSRDETIRRVVTNLIFRGFAPLHLQNLDNEGRPRFATPINPDEVQVSWDETQTVEVYHWRDRRMLRGVDLEVIELTRLPGEPKGLGPFDAVRDVLQGVRDANAWAADLFANSGIPSGTLTVPGKLTKGEAKDLRKQWEKQHAGQRATAVLSGGMSYSQTALSADQLEALATRAFGQQEIARVLGIPAHFMNVGQPQGSSNALTYTNIQSLFSELTRVTLYPQYLRRIEEAFTRLLPRGQEASFDLSDFTRADDGTRYTAWKTAIEAGVLTVDEVRAMEGLRATDRTGDLI